MKKKTKETKKISKPRGKSGHKISKNFKRQKDPKRREKTKNIN